MTERLIATLSVPRAHAVFTGHFPGRPIVPGVMLLEWMLGEVAVLRGCERHELRIRDAKFLEPLLPDETAQLRITETAARCSYRICRDETLLASGSVESP